MHLGGIEPGILHIRLQLESANRQIEKKRDKKYDLKMFQVCDTYCLTISRVISHYATALRDSWDRSWVQTTLADSCSDCSIAGALSF